MTTPNQRLAIATWALQFNSRTGVEYRGPEVDAICLLIEAGKGGEGLEPRPDPEELERLRWWTAYRLAHLRVAEEFPALAEFYVGLGLAELVSPEMFGDLLGEVATRFEGVLERAAVARTPDLPPPTDQAPLTLAGEFQNELHAALVEQTAMHCRVHREKVARCVARYWRHRLYTRRSTSWGVVIRWRMARKARNLSEDQWRALVREARRDWGPGGYSSRELAVDLRDRL